MSRVVVVGAGPAGLMAAQVLMEAGHDVQVFDRMPSVGRKLLRAGIGGLNLTHAEPFERFVTRYGVRQAICTTWLLQWGPQALRQWAAHLGVDTFVGSSQRVFPVGMKAAPLLRAWLQQLKNPPNGCAVQFHLRHCWSGELTVVKVPDAGSDGAAQSASTWNVGFVTPDGPVQFLADVVVFALGGGSWPQLGSDGAWVPWLTRLGMQISPLRASNCGFNVRTGASPADEPVAASQQGQQPVAPEGGTAQGWSAYFADRFAGTPMKTVVLQLNRPDGKSFRQRGEFVFTRTGVEGSLIYAASSMLREAIAEQGFVKIELDLKPDWSEVKVAQALGQTKHGRSLSSTLKGKLGFSGVHTALLHEVLPPHILASPLELAKAIKSFPLLLGSPRPISEAISTAGGLRLEALSDDLMALQMPGLFFAGEMLDWDAPTGGYLLTASLASGRVAGLGAVQWLNQNKTPWLTHRK